MSDVWLTELGRLLPELRDRYPDLPVPAGDEVAARTRLFEAIARLGQALAQRAPVVLFIDDVQWADASTLDVLRYTGRRWADAGAPLLTLLCMRSEALADSPALDEWLVGIRRDRVVTEIDPRLLTADETLQLIQGFGGGRSQPVGPDIAHVAHWLFDETGGHPFFAVETIRELVDRGVLVLRGGALELPPSASVAVPAQFGTILPPGVRDLIRTRLTRLGRPAREFLAAAAVIGQRFTFDQVSAVAGLSKDEALSASDAVVGAQRPLALNWRDRCCTSLIAYARTRILRLTRICRRSTSLRLFMGHRSCSSSDGFATPWHSYWSLRTILRLPLS